MKLVLKSRGIHYALWHHRHGVDVLLNQTRAGRDKTVCDEVIAAYLDELDDEEIGKKIKDLIAKKKYPKAIDLWGHEQSEGRGKEEYLDFGTTLIGE